MKILYTAKAISEGGRDGKVTVENSSMEFQMAPPSELGGSGKSGTNPEQLFAAGYSACFGSALQLVANRKKVLPKSSSIAVEVGIGSDHKGGFSLEVSIVGTFSGINQAEADMLVQEAHKVCPYSNATRGNIDVTVSAKIEE